MSQFHKAFLGAVALAATLGAVQVGAVQLASGHDLTDRWKAIYAQRIQAVVAPLRAAKVPVIWVGLPPMRSEKFNAEMIEDLIDGSVTYVVDQFERAKPRERIRRFDHHAQERQRIFDVR